MIAGTRGFMAPEQEQGAIDRCLDRRLRPRRDAARDPAVEPSASARRDLRESDRDRASATATRPCASSRTTIANWLDGQPVTAYRENIFERAGRWLSRNRALVTIVARVPGHARHRHSVGPPLKDLRADVEYDLRRNNMNKILVGLLLGAVLGAVDGMTAWFTPAVRAGIIGIVIGSTVKGMIAGIAAGWFARKVQSVAWGIAFGLLVGALLAYGVAAMQHGYYFEIMLPGSIVGAIVGWATQRYGRDLHPQMTQI